MEYPVFEPRMLHQRGRLLGSIFLTGGSVDSIGGTVRCFRDPALTPLGIHLKLTVMMMAPPAYNRTYNLVAVVFGYMRPE